jgi:hypothetical protein
LKRVNFIEAYLIPVALPIVIGMMSVRPGDVRSNLEEWLGLGVSALIDRRYALIIIPAALLYFLFLLFRAINSFNISAVTAVGVGFSAISLIAVIAYLGGTNDPVPQPVVATCQLPQHFTLLKSTMPTGRTRAVWSIMYSGQLAYRFDQAELDDLYGGAAPPSNCAGIFSGQNFFALNVGRLNDLLVAFGIVKHFGFVTGLQKMYFYPHDSPMNITVIADDLLVNFGRLHDLNARFCWNFQGDNLWWHNQSTRAAPDTCVSKSWPFMYPLSGSPELPAFSKTQFIARDIMSLLYLDQIMGAERPW